MLGKREIKNWNIKIFRNLSYTCLAMKGAVGSTGLKFKGEGGGMGLEI